MSSHFSSTVLRKFGGLDQCLDLLSSVGFRHVEPVMAHYQTPALTRAALDQRGLSAPSGHFSLEAVTDRTSWVAEVAKTIGIEQVVVPAVPPEQRSGAAKDWHKLGLALAGSGSQLAEDGLTLAYHNHDWDLRTLDDGRTPLDVLFEHPSIKWQADMGWVARAVSDPVAWLSKYEDRLVSCHVKDVAPEGENLDEDGWTDVGQGTLDWTNLWAICRATPAKWMVVEHDNPKHFEQFVKRSFAFLANLAA